MSSHTQELETKMKKALEHLQEDLNTVRVGRANPHILDKIQVSYYGVPTPVAQVGNITVPEPRTIQIQPWDAAVLKDIEKAISASDLGINPTNDGKVIRLSIPELTEERRKELTKDVKKKGEEAKIAVRNIRRDGIEDFKKKEKKSEITEDELSKIEDEIQKLTDGYVENIDKIIEAKNKDIVSI